MCDSNEYLLDDFSFSEWQREKYLTDLDDSKQFSDIVQKVIQNELSEKEKTIIRLYYYEHCTQRSIADKLGCNVSTVCRSIDTIHKKLYKFLKYAAEFYFGRKI